MCSSLQTLFIGAIIKKVPAVAVHVFWSKVIKFSLSLTIKSLD